MILSKMYHIRLEPQMLENSVGSQQNHVSNKFEHKAEHKKHFDELLDNYTVKQGDTLYKIARNVLINNGMKAGNREIYSMIRKITAINHIDNPNKIFRGQVIHLEGINNLSSEKFISPIKGRITSPFGMRLDPFTHIMKFHTGVDIAAPIGTPVHAAKSGKVIFSGRQRGYGNIVIIQHSNNIITKYAHNSKLLVKKGDYVTQGEIISRVGSTGRSTGPHLHFEIRVKNKAVNPLTFVKV